MHGAPSPTRGSYYDPANPIRDRSEWHRLPVRARRNVARLARSASWVTALFATGWFAAAAKLEMLSGAEDGLERGAEKAVEIVEQHATAAAIVTGVGALVTARRMINSGQNRRVRQAVAEQALRVTAEVRLGDDDGRCNWRFPNASLYIHNGHGASVDEVWAAIAIDRVYVQGADRLRTRDVVLVSMDETEQVQMRPDDSWTMALVAPGGLFLPGISAVEDDARQRPQPAWVRTSPRAREYPRAAHVVAQGGVFDAIVDMAVVEYGYEMPVTRQPVVIRNPWGDQNAAMHRGGQTVEVAGRLVSGSRLDASLNSL